jgi:hypothetical protein
MKANVMFQLKAFAVSRLYSYAACPEWNKISKVTEETLTKLRVEQKTPQNSRTKSLVTCICDYRRVWIGE